MLCSAEHTGVEPARTLRHPLLQVRPLNAGQEGLHPGEGTAALLPVVGGAYISVDAGSHKAPLFSILGSAKIHW